MKLFWSSRSPFVRKVMIAAHELGLADRLELEPVVVALAQPNDAVMAHNPLNKIPTLITDDGQTLFESGLICEYLDGLAGTPRLFPTGPARWPALRWHALGTGLLEVLILWRSERMRPDGQRSDAVVAALARKAEATLARLEQEADALAAAPVTIGPIALGAALGYLDFRFAAQPWRPGHDRLAAWYATFARRPSMQATTPHD
jgi:glutathione S-transferase